MMFLAPMMSACDYLTIDNWLMAGVNFFAYPLDKLFIKPGLSVIQALSGWSDYITFDGYFVVDASMFPFVQENYTLRSGSDGSKLSIDKASLDRAISALKPNIILVCDKESAMRWLDILPNALFYLKVTDSPDNNPWQSITGIHLDLIVFNKMPNRATLEPGGDALGAVEAPHFLCESEMPLFHSSKGIAYTMQKPVYLLEACFENAHCPLDLACQCYACASKFTRAYFHYLLRHTPLLANRLLALHNVHFLNHHSFKADLRKE